MMAEFSQLALLIDGQWRPSASDETIPLLNPATAEVIGHLPVASRADLDNALAAAPTGSAAPSQLA